MEIPFLKDFAVIFGLSIAVLLVCHRLRIPTIVGFLVTGALAGPSGFELIHAHEEVEVLAEIGVVLLLFTIGIEFSLENLLRIRKSILVGGTLQVLLTFAAGFAVASQCGLPRGPSMFLGFLLSLSSTAIVLKSLQQRSELESPHGQTALAILIFQDVIIVPMMLLTPVLAGDTKTVGDSLVPLLMKGTGIVVLSIISAKWLVPWILYQVAKTRSPELFSVTIVMICLSVAWLTSAAGLSIGLGAFLAGLIISESKYSSQALGGILPFRDVFSSFFFISIGMLLDTSYLFQEPGWILLLTVSVLFLKGAVAALVTFFLGFPPRTFFLVGISLCQIGEFSFLLSKVGLEHNLFVGNTYQLFLAVSVLTMALTPFLLALSPRIVEWLERLPIPDKLRSRWKPLPESEESEKKRNHLIIIGFGINGRNLARAARRVGIPYVIIEMNAETVRKEQARGEPIFYGDAVHEAVLEHASIEEARVMVLAIPDPVATRKITKLARDLNPVLHVIVRTRFLGEMRPLCELGASEVIPEEFETSVEIFTRVLNKYHIPQDEIERFTTEVRADGYEMLRTSSVAPLSLSDLPLAHSEMEMTVVRVQDASPASGKTLVELQLRQEHQVTVLGIHGRNDDQMTLQVDAQAPLGGGDLIMLLGKPSQLREAARLFRSTAPRKRASVEETVGDESLENA